MPGGRPEKYTPKLGLEIAQRIASGESLRRVCQDEGMPTKRTVINWLFDEDKKEFLHHYAQAREVQAEGMADELLDIADDGDNDWMEGQGKNSEGWRLNGEHVQRSRLRVDTRKWVASKLLAKKYGDKLDVNHAGSVTVELVRFKGQASE